MSAWQNLTTEQQKEVFQKLASAAEAHGKPSQLKISATTEIINILNIGKQENRYTLSISANFPESDKALAEALKASVQEAVSGVSDAEVEIACSKTIGSDMGLIENVGFITGQETTTIKHEPGQVILLDFWATWCPPCQKPMAHNQEMLEKHAELGDWKNVRIIGLSRDKNQNALEQRVTEKKWTSVEQYWQANGKSEAHKDYKVNGIPHCVLVDTHGKIVWVGHPMSRNLEEDITNLLAGKTLDVKASADSDEKEGESNPTAGLDYDKAVEAVKLFEAETKSLQEPEAVERAKDVPRAFLVLVNEAKLDITSGEVKSKLTCHTSMMGPKDKVEALQASTNAISHKEGAQWENRVMVRPQ